MRMWMVNPQVMCRQHLLGEHLEIHMLRGNIVKGKSVFGYIMNGLIEFNSLFERHNELVNEIKLRGYNHKSPLKDFVVKNGSDLLRQSKVNKKKSLKELLYRCKECRKRHKIIGGS